MNQDFQPPLRSPSAFRRRRWPLLLILLLLPGLWLLLDHRPQVQESEARSEPAEIRAPQPPPPPEPRAEELSGVIQPGDTLTALLGDFFTPAEIHLLGEQSREVFPLSRICAGQPYKICVLDGSFDRFEYDIDRSEQLVITRSGAAFDVTRVPIPYTVTIDRVRGEIATSLFDAVTAIGERPELALALAEIFAWDIDFILDIREGDTFQVLVEKRFREGEPAGYGQLLAAEFTNRGEVFRAVRFKDGDRQPAYYDPEGQSLRKAFLKAPLDFTRISSGFTLRRFHPITKTWKAHPAIDYAAPTGTPIKSVGDGTVIRKGYTRGNGNYVKIRHNSSYETMYLHMKGFARGIRQGGRVSQGQVIGYVGSTGLATGPHLCFRMYQNGAPVNPQRVKAKPAAPVSTANLEAFRQQAAPLLSALEGGPLGELVAGAAQEN